MNYVLMYLYQILLGAPLKLKPILPLIWGKLSGNSPENQEPGDKRQKVFCFPFAVYCVSHKRYPEPATRQNCLRIWCICAFSTNSRVLTH